MSLKKVIKDFLISIEEEILPKLPNWSVFINNLIPKEIYLQNEFCEDIWLPRFFSNKIDMPRVNWLIKECKEEIFSLDETNELIDKLRGLFLDETMDFYKLLIALINLLVIPYFEWKLINLSTNQKYDLDYASDTILGYLIFLSSYFFHKNKGFLIWKFFAKTIEEENPNVKNDKKFLEFKNTSEKLYDRLIEISENIKKYSKDVNKIDYQRIFFLNGICLEDNNFRVLRSNYFVRKLDFNDLNLFRIVEYGRKKNIISISKGEKRIKWDRNPTILFSNFKEIEGLFPAKPGAVLEFKGSIYPWELLDIEINLYKITNLLNFFKLSPVRAVGFAVNPPFLKNILWDIRILLRKKFDENYTINSILDPHKMRLSRRDGSLLREFISKTIGRFPIVDFTKSQSIREAINRYNKAIFSVRELDTTLGQITDDYIAESIFLTISGLEALFKTENEKRGKEKILLGERVGFLLSHILNDNYKQEETIINDIHKAYRDIRSGYAHASISKRNELEWVDDLKLLIRLLDYLRLSIIFFTLIKPEDREKIINYIKEKNKDALNKYNEIYNLLRKIVENNIDELILDKKRKYLEFIQEKFTPLREIQFYKELFDMDET